MMCLLGLVADRSIPFVVVWGEHLISHPSPTVRMKLTEFNEMPKRMFLSLCYRECDGGVSHILVVTWASAWSSTSFPLSHSSLKSGRQLRYIAVMTCMFANVQVRRKMKETDQFRICYRLTPEKNGGKQGLLLTLPPLSSAERYLAFDELEHVKLEHRVLNFEYTFQNRLFCVKLVSSCYCESEIENTLTELLYWTIILILCDLCFDSFCMIFAKLIVAKKFLHEKSVRRSISSSCFCPFGRTVVLTTACRGGLII